MMQHSSDRLFRAPQSSRWAQTGSAWLGAVVFTSTLLASTLLAACTSPPPQPHAHDPITWSAAIGRLDDEKDDSSCSATLVAPDVIATAAHCVFLDDRLVDASALTFHPNLGGADLPPSQGTKIIAVGAYTKGSRSDEKTGAAAGNDLKRLISADDPLVAGDWALVRLSPPIAAVTPIPVGRFTAADIDDSLAKGGSLSQAGYGVYGLSLGQHLYQQGNCRHLTDSKTAENLRDYVLFTSCRPIKGDSGGPLLLTKASGERYLVGVISEYRFTHESADRITAAASTLGFAHEIAGAP
jgi:V8-like Glu-specific endopeptidase